MGHGRTIIPIESPEQQAEVYERIIADNLSICDTEELVRRIQNPETTEVVSVSLPKNNSKTEVPSYIKERISTFNHFLSTKVAVKMSKDGKGSLTISFNSGEDFKRMQRLLGKKDE